MARVPTMFSAHGESYAFLLANLVTAPLRARFVMDDVIDVTDEAFAFDRGRFAVAEAAFASVLPFNEQTLAPYALKHEPNTTVISLHSSHYSAYRAAREQFEERSLEERSLAVSRGVSASFSHTFGVNATVETADGQLVLVRRSVVNESSVGQLSISVSENSNVYDVVEGAYDPTVTLLRGLEEELGLTAADLTGPVVFHSLIGQIPDAQLSLSAHVVTALESSEVLQRHVSATDAHEAGGFVVIAFTPENIEQLLDEHPSWVPWAPPALIGALRVRFGDDAAEGVRERVLSPPRLPVA
jgi:hypothetical protein